MLCSIPLCTVSFDCTLYPVFEKLFLEKTLMMVSSSRKDCFSLVPGGGRAYRWEIILKFCWTSQIDDAKLGCVFFYCYLPLFLVYPSLENIALAVVPQSKPRMFTKEQLRCREGQAKGPSSQSAFTNWVLWVVLCLPVALPSWGQALGQGGAGQTLLWSGCLPSLNVSSQAWAHQSAFCFSFQPNPVV